MERYYVKEISKHDGKFVGCTIWDAIGETYVDALGKRITQDEIEYFEQIPTICTFDNLFKMILADQLNRLFCRLLNAEDREYLLIVQAFNCEEKKGTI
jgi:hypothetical protein